MEQQTPAASGATQTSEGAPTRRSPAGSRLRPPTLGLLALVLAITIELAAVGVAIAARAAAPLQTPAASGDQIIAFVVVQGIAMLIPIALGWIAAVTGRGRRAGIAAVVVGLACDLLVIGAVFAAIGALGGYLFSGGSAP